MTAARRPMLSREVSDAAIDIAELVARRLSTARSLGRGLCGPAGISMLYAALAEATNDVEYARLAHHFLSQAASSGEPPIRRLFSGVDGLLAAATYASRIDPLYARLANRCEVAVEQSPSPELGKPLSFDVYDIVSGWAGDCLAFYMRPPSVAKRQSLNYLIWLTAGERDRWSCPHPLDRLGAPRNDLGMAHGIAGVLSALTLISPEGSPVHDAAIKQIAAWIAANTIDASSPCWGGYIDPRGQQPARAAWCYGTPGVAAALFQAAVRINDIPLQQLAIDALERQSEAPIDTWGMKDHAICHGSMGNALIFASVGVASGNLALLNIAEQLVTRVVDSFNKNYPYGYLGASLDEAEGAANLLEGASGIALSLLTLACRADPSWMVYFGLAPAF